MAVKIINGDCRDVLRTLPDGSVNCCVTSPPYFGLRDYGVDGQIGLEQTPDAFVAEMVAVFREVRRVLRDDGVLFLNLGDSYFGSNQTGGTKSKEGSAKRAGRMFSKPAGGPRAIACDKPGTEPEGSPANGCLCGNLCGACRAAYQIGRSHSDIQPVPMPAASSGASSLEHMGSPSGHAPTSGLVRQDAHNEDANHDRAPSVRRAAEPLHGGPASMTPESSQLHQASSRQSGQPLECQLCGCSLRDCDLAFSHKAECNCGTSSLGLASGNLGMDASGLAYPHSTTKSLKPKDLIGIPWRVAFALQADGWYLRQDIIWSKPNPMPESVQDRCTKAHEYIFMLSKSARYFYDIEAIKEPMSVSSVARLEQDIEGQAGSDRVPGKTNGAMKAVGKVDKQRGHGRRHAGFNDRWDAMEKEGQCSGMRNKRSVWTVATQPFKEAHFATFPPDLIEPCIKAGCPVGGTVIDPFAGAGTTGLVADRLQRNAVLIELNPAYAEMARDRVASDAGMFSEVAA